MKPLQHTLALFLCLAAFALAREVPVRYFLEDGAEHQGTFLKLARDTVYLRVQSNDSSLVEVAQYKLEFRRILQAENDSIVNLDLSDFVFPDPVVEVEEVIPPYPAGNAHIKVISEPEACRLYINGKDLDVLTPYTIANVQAGKYEIAIRKYLKDVDWWGSEKIKLKENETLTVKIKVERPRTELSVLSLPEAAEVYIDEEPSLHRMPAYYTDATVKNIRPKLESTIRLRKVGYQDTAVTTEIKAFTPNMVYIEMEPIRDNLAKLEMQTEFNQQRQRKWIGRGLLWGSIAPFLAGGTLWYLAERDWQKAADLKDKYESSALRSAQTDQYIKDNKEYNDSGDTKAIIGASLGAVGLILAGVGITFQF
jgi:hypothetical protein